MAQSKITLSAAAPQLSGSDKIEFVFSGGSFTLGTGGEYVTDSLSIIGDASVNPFLTVVPVEEPAVADEAVEVDMNDPHVNPAADHLSALASQDAIDAAAANAAAIQATAAGDDAEDAQAPDAQPQPSATTTDTTAAQPAAKQTPSDTAASTADTSTTGASS